MKCLLGSDSLFSLKVETHEGGTRLGRNMDTEIGINIAVDGGSGDVDASAHVEVKMPSIDVEVKSKSPKAPKSPSVDVEVGGGGFCCFGGKEKKSKSKAVSRSTRAGLQVRHSPLANLSSTQKQILICHRIYKCKIAVATRLLGDEGNATLPQPMTTL